MKELEVMRDGTGKIIFLMLPNGLTITPDQLATALANGAAAQAEAAELREALEYISDLNDPNAAREARKALDTPAPAAQRGRALLDLLGAVEAQIAEGRADWLRVEVLGAYQRAKYGEREP